ncbi:MAG: Peptidase family [Candidatus Berkelbacteria bacterium]|nr:Peptidase family [Candidatus Berkelbacteria bacterium]
MIKNFFQRIGQKNIIVFISIILVSAISTFVVLQKLNSRSEKMVGGVDIISEDTATPQAEQSPAKEEPTPSPSTAKIQNLNSALNTSHPTNNSEQKDSNNNQNPNNPNNPNNPMSTHAVVFTPSPTPTPLTCKSLNEDTPAWSGSRVITKRGEQIGKVGSTGLTSGPRLDLYYVSDSNVRLNPSSYITQDIPLLSSSIGNIWKFGDKDTFHASGWGYSEILDYYIFPALYNASIYAIKDGELVYNNYKGGYGHMKVYAHQDCTYTLYAHLIP